MCLSPEERAQALALMERQAAATERVGDALWALHALLGGCVEQRNPAQPLDGARLVVRTE